MPRHRKGPELVPVNAAVLRRLLEHQRQAGVPNTAIAKQARMSVATLSHLKTGRNQRVRKDERARLARALRVSTDVLEGKPPARWSDVAIEWQDAPAAEPGAELRQPWPSRALLEAKGLTEMLEAAGVGAVDAGHVYAWLARPDTLRALLGIPDERAHWIQQLVEPAGSGEYAASVSRAVRRLLLLDTDTPLRPAPDAIETLAACVNLFKWLRMAAQAPGTGGNAELKAALERVGAIAAPLLQRRKAK